MERTRADAGDHLRDPNYGDEGGENRQCRGRRLWDIPPPLPPKKNHRYRVSSPRRHAQPAPPCKSGRKCSPGRPPLPPRLPRPETPPGIITPEPRIHTCGVEDDADYPPARGDVARDCKTGRGSEDTATASTLCAYSDRDDSRLSEYGTPTGDVKTSTQDGPVSAVEVTVETQGSDDSKMIRITILMLGDKAPGASAPMVVHVPTIDMGR
uniref:Uncharacterized protein n=1 Tax=Anatid alphaherpesvirus 2 TaxID=3080522 RepID=A0AAU0K8H8_9ALPH